MYSSVICINGENEPLTNPLFFMSYIECKQFARESVKTYPYDWHVYFGNDSRCRIDFFHVNIFKGEKLLETVYDDIILASMKIQKAWRKRFTNRLIAAFIIRKHIKRAIANPSTQMCKNRLLREFYEMV